MSGEGLPARFGCRLTSNERTEVLQPGPVSDVLGLLGPKPCRGSLSSALADLIDLVLDRARSAEEHARIERRSAGKNCGPRI